MASVCGLHCKTKQEPWNVCKPSCLSPVRGSLCQSEVILKCPISMVAIPVVDARGRTAVLKRKKTRGNFWGKRKPKRAAKKPTKKDREELPVTYMKWPVLSPALLFEAIVKAEAWELIAGPNWCWWRNFWSQAKSEDWAYNHPVYELGLEDQQRSVACSFHGDEGQGKRSRNVLILSWSSIAMTGPSEYCKFPFAVSWLPWQLRVFCFRNASCMP